MQIFTRCNLCTLIKNEVYTVTRAKKKKPPKVEG